MSENVEIILNEVNVSGCEYLVNAKIGLTCDLHNLMDCGHYSCSFRCSDNPNCYYKQLQREKQKNEKTEKTLKRD